MYCSSKNITPAGMKRAIRRYLSYGIGIWFSPDSEKRETITFCQCIGCRRCGANYLVMDVDRQKLSELISSLNPQESALQNFRDEFGRTPFVEWQKHVTAVIKPEKNTLHIFFRICRIRAYLNCSLIEGHFTIVSMEKVVKW